MPLPKIVLLLIKLIIIILLAIAQISLIPNLPFPLNHWQIFLSIIAVVFLKSEKFGNIFYWALFFGLLINFYSLHPIFVVPILFFITILIANLFFVKFFTNRSWYSLIALSITVTIVYNLIETIVICCSNFICFQNSGFILTVFLIDFVFKIFVNMCGAILFFAVFKNKLNLYGQKYFSKF
ncbi:MAG: hypothetical protein U9O55_00340 [Patescibacteria group bacterium]|nr:hypothetical protein [Patescibacteria group bacterium]